MWTLVTYLNRRGPIASPSTPRRTTFSSLRTRNFRLFATGQIFSSTGWWVLSIAQGWLVLSLTGSPAAVGLTTALIFVPTIALGVVGGALADRFPKRRILLCASSGLGLLAATLALLTLTGVVQAWHVQLVAVGVGVCIALNDPARQAFIHEMVGPDQLRNAVSLSNALFQLGGLVGPALSGVLLGVVGPGWSFLITAVSYLAPVIALSRIRDQELHTTPPAPAQRGQFRAGLRFAAGRTDIVVPTILIGVFGMFTANLAVTLAAYAHAVFDIGASGYGLLTSVVAVGSLVGALISARQGRSRVRTLMVFAGALSVLYAVAAVAALPVLFCVVLLGIGAFTMLLYTTNISSVQLATPGAIRGRVMALYLLVFYSSASVGGILVGTVDERLGPQAGMLLAGVAPGIASALIGLWLVVRHRRTRVLPAPEISAAVEGGSVAPRPRAMAGLFRASPMTRK